jgi:hypothetical protein
VFPLARGRQIPADARQADPRWRGDDVQHAAREKEKQSGGAVKLIAICKSPEAPPLCFPNFQRLTVIPAQEGNSLPAAHRHPLASGELETSHLQNIFKPTGYFSAQIRINTYENIIRIHCYQ